MIDQDLLSILACPATHQPLAVANAEALAALNARISAGGVKNVGGKDVTEALTEGLLREDGKVLYPIRDGIPFLLAEEGIEVAGG